MGIRDLDLEEGSDTTKMGSAGFEALLHYALCLTAQLLYQPVLIYYIWVSDQCTETFWLIILSLSSLSFIEYLLKSGDKIRSTDPFWTRFGYSTKLVSVACSITIIALELVYLDSCEHRWSLQCLIIIRAVMCVCRIRDIKLRD